MTPQSLPSGPTGLHYRCLNCDADFVSPSGADRHARTRWHTVERCDWFAPDYFVYVKTLPEWRP